MKHGLQHPEAEERRRAVAALSAGEVAHSLADLYSLLDDADWRVRREVALALARLRDPAPAIEPLVDAVETGDVARRNAAMEALRNIGAVAAPSVLARFAAGKSAARRFLIEVLADIGDERCVGPLAGALDDNDGNIPPAAAEAIGRITGESARKALIGALLHRDAVVRLAALQAFSRRGETLPFAIIEPLLRDPICRRAALRAAAMCSETAAVEAIVGALSDANAALSSEAAVAAASAIRRGRREAFRAALQSRAASTRVLRHLAERASGTEVRRSAVECLGVIADPASVVAVLRATESSETASAATDALDNFGAESVPHALAAVTQLGPDASAPLMRWALSRARRDDHEALVRYAWQALQAGTGGVAPWDVIAALGSRADAEALIARLESPAQWLDPEEQARPLVMLLARHPEVAGILADRVPVTTRLGLIVAEMVASAGYAVPLEPLREQLTAEDPTVRAAAVRALGALGALGRPDSTGALDALEFALADEDSTVQAAAAEALGALGAGADLLEESLRAAEPRVRRAAARAIARRGDNVRTVLLAALDDPDAGVVLAALEGIGDEAQPDDLANLATHRDPDVASEALVRLRALDPKRASESALTMLDHAVWSVRLEAVRSLDSHDSAALAALKRRAESERDELVCEAIQSALAPRGAAPR